LTPKLNHRAYIDELDAYLEIIGNVIADGKRDSGIGALCMMALVVRRFPQVTCAMRQRTSSVHTSGR
jgi:hypothetical protein